MSTGLALLWVLPFLHVEEFRNPAHMVAAREMYSFVGMQKTYNEETFSYAGSIERYGSLHNSSSWSSSLLPQAQI